MIAKTTDQFAAETAVQIINATNAVLIRLTKSLATGIPADDARKTPALTADALKDALGADAVTKLQALVAAYNA